MAQEKISSVAFKIKDEDLDLLDRMVLADDTDRSKLIRRLIRQEASRRSVELITTSAKQAKRSTRQSLPAGG